MKKFYYLLMVMLMALVVIGVTACGDEDEPYDIVGTWQMSYASGETIIQFTENGAFHEVDISTLSGKTEIYVDHGYYRLSGNKVIIVFDDDIDGSDTVESTYSIRGNEITFYSTDYTETYVRVSDSAIERYLYM